MEKRQSDEETPATRPPTTVNDIPDHLLDTIFRRLDSHVAAVRAAAVCTRWRRISSTRGIRNAEGNGHSFSTFMGHYHVAGPSFSPRSQRRRGVVFIPASPSIDARHFALDFLPTSGPDRRRCEWELIDGHGSLLLLAYQQQQRRGDFPDLVVCEPISRRHVRIQPFENAKHCRCLGVFLDNGGYGVAMSMSNFSLTCVLYEPSVGIADDGGSVVTGRVYRHQPPGWSRWKYGWSSSRLASSGANRVHLRRGADSAHYAGRSKGFIFWGIEDDGTVLSATTRGAAGTGVVLSHFRLPEHVHGGSHHRSTFRFIDDRPDNSVHVVSLISNELRVFLKQEDDDGGSEWVYVRNLHLPEATRGLPGYKECFFSRTAKIVTAGKGYVVLTPAEETWQFSVELGTMQVEREHIRNRLAGELYPYELCLPPRVRVCVFRCKRRRNGPCYRICKCKQVN